MKAPRPKRSWPSLCAVICINEVFPREKKYGFYIPPDICGALARLEYEGLITRRGLRRAYDKFYQLVEEGVVTKDGQLAPIAFPGGKVGIKVVEVK